MNKDVLLIFKESSQSYKFTVMIKKYGLHLVLLAQFKSNFLYVGLLHLHTEIAPSHLTANTERTI